MKICVTSTGPSLDAPVDPRFGRCQYFMIVDSETMEYEAMQNPSIGAVRRHRLLQVRASASLPPETRDRMRSRHSLLPESRW